MYNLFDVKNQTLPIRIKDSLRLHKLRMYRNATCLSRNKQQVL